MKNRSWKKYASWFVVLALFLVVGALAPQIQNQVWAQGQGKFLADRHQEKGTNCAACHKESPPKDAVSSEACIKCHGNMEKVALKTDKVKPVNPHESGQCLRPVSSVRIQGSVNMFSMKGGDER